MDWSFPPEYPAGVKLCKNSRPANGSPDASNGGGSGGVEPALPVSGFAVFVAGGEYVRNRGSTAAEGCKTF